MSKEGARFISVRGEPVEPRTATLRQAQGEREMKHAKGGYTHG
jgi:hypothetical protein